MENTSNNTDGGRPSSRRSGGVSLGLVGVPTLSEDSQPAAEYEGYFDANTIPLDPAWFESDVFSEALDAQIQSIPDSVEGTQSSFNPDESTWSTEVDLAQQNPYIPQPPYAYPPPQGYYQPQVNPYFSNGFEPFSLAAIPGNNAFPQAAPQMYPYQMNYLPMAQPAPVHHGYLPMNQFQQVEYMPMAQTEYHTGHVPMDNSYEVPAMPPQTYPLEVPQPVTAVPAPAQVPVVPALNANIKRRQIEYSDSDSASDSEYREDSPITTKASKQATRKKARKNSIDDVAPTPQKRVRYTPGEKPKKIEGKSWVRINTSTQGDTRTAKINNWVNTYVYQPLPLGSWNSGKYTFEYAMYENVDFLTDWPMKTKKIKEYIFNYPNDEEKRLTLWIQKMPSDTASRYGSDHHSKCIFEDCPVVRFMKGTINTGEYRVAFDEKYFTYNGKTDPFDCVAFAHLYCMERFLDFEQVCQVADVRVDTRFDMKLEPNGKAAFSMVDVPSRDEMEAFVKAASKGQLRQRSHWANYPVGANYSKKDPKPHELTLTYLAHLMYDKYQDKSHKRQAYKRAEIRVSQRRVHMGDLEMSVADKIIDFKYNKGKSMEMEDYYDYYDQHTLNELARTKQTAEELKALWDAEDAEKAAGKKGRGKKRKQVELEETDEDESAGDPVYAANARVTRSKKQRVDYAQSPQASFVQAQPAQAQAQAHEQQLQLVQAYVNTGLEPAPQAAQPQLSIDPSLETMGGPVAVPQTPNFNIDDFPKSEEDLPEDNLEKLLGLDRRQSNIASILKSPRATRSGRTPRSATFDRRAMFNSQPVTENAEYGVNDPPSSVSGRRSARLAKKDSVGERRS
ncbi:hypothetical protein E8E13_005902 [Curvularia kusanoi]|uniref:Uncharacterized protein n=1 Tax=Curvularia kusanoi TaxID=90978 RepID=A0A9P4W744_CURKU|nr:hypothetical protein E8E13_005902 [Curvularia kusanoi]